MSASDATLLERWHRSRDADAFAELVARHSGMVYATCRRILGDPASAEDVVQECFIDLLRLRKTDRPSLGGWLHTVAAHRSLDRLKAEKRRRRRESSFAPAETSKPEPQWEEIKPHVDAAIAALPDRLREAVVLRFLEARTQEAVAAELGLSRSAAQYRIERGVESVRHFLKRRGIAVPGATLAALLTARTAEAVPAGLTAAIGQHALAGFVPAAFKLALMGGGAIVFKKIAAGVAVIVALLLVAGYFGGSDVLGRWMGASDATTQSADLLASSEAAPAAPAASQATPPPPAAPAPETAVAQDAATGAGAAASGKAADKKPAEEGFHQPDKIDPPMTVSGTVYDEAAYPVAGAQVYVEATNNWRGPGTVAQYEAVTDDEGRYSIAGIEAVARNYAASAVASGYRMQTEVIESIKAGGELTVDFTLAKAQAALRGRVVTERKEAVAQARVELLLMADQRPQPVTLRHGGRLSFATTNEEGLFEMGALNEGLCEVCVLAGDNPPVIFKGLSTGPDVHELVLTGATGSIAGSVTKPDGTPADGYRVLVSTVYTDGGPGIYEYRLSQREEFQTVAQGKYRFDGLSPGFQHSVSLWPPQEGRYLDIKDGVQVAANEVITVDLVAQERARLVGRATYDDGRPIPRELRFRACEAEGQGREVGVPEKLNPEDGSYEMSLAIRGGDRLGVIIDAYYFSQALPRPVEAREALVGGPSVVEVASGEEKRLDLTFQRPLAIQVQAVDGAGEPVPGLVVGFGTISPDGRRNPSYPSYGATDAEGKYTFPYMDANWTCYAWLSSAAEDALDPSRALVESGPITGGAGDTVPVVLVVAELGGLEGVLVDANDAPIANRPLEITGVAADGAARSVTGQTDGDGAFVLTRALPPGRYDRVTLRVALDESGAALTGTVLNVEVVKDAIANVGRVVCMALNSE